MVETQFGTKIKTIRSDNGKEFDMRDFFLKRGIIHHKTCVKTPQQNAIAERKHQHILNVARVLKFLSGISLKYWNHCVLTAVYLINRTPSPLPNDRSPFEILFKTKPNYTRHKVFGCLAFATTLANGKHKFDPRDRKYVFIRYPFGIKGYRLLDLDTKKIFISRNVIFYETIFPFKDYNISNVDILSNPNERIFTQDLDILIPNPLVNNDPFPENNQNTSSEKPIIAEPPDSQTNEMVSSIDQPTPEPEID